ncbi:16S rRNA (uracil(1498)-N(3))-methyltransferase [Candidatus Soleaferrea massiliensis]|uniref:16S rRNA (uracil(1498)-N(3))-methyltransferase n=1 Tax=Candidatus Soleaferrea massiliensis TaxID=1470354 RepID=UPI00058D6496|nr:16S rRNA (uracil(1498)-N(3))-methyltransferase [Candidatus Soleaferrea massiliensis]
MPRFFIDVPPVSDTVTLTGEDARHLSRSLRMKEGEAVTVSDQQGTDYRCTIRELGQDHVLLYIEDAVPCHTEPSVRVRLYQALAKSDKFEWIVQKAVELGVSEIIPVYTARCVSVPDQKSMRKKEQRYQKIALEAAKQSGRGIIPQVKESVSFQDAISGMLADDLPLLFYEGGGEALSALVRQEYRTISILIGPEGGFSEEEVRCALLQGVHAATLGSRILRCETAPVCALSVIMYQTGNLS